MRRYVTEFANDMIRLAEALKCPAAVTQIDRIVRACERGYITNFEAVNALTEITLDKED